MTYVKLFFDQETLRYALNPVMNPDFEHTEIYASFVVREKGATIIESTPCLDLIVSGSSGPEQILCNLCCGDNALDILNRLSGTNMAKSVDSKERITPPVLVDYINEVVAEVALEDHLSDLSGLEFNIRFLVNLQSTDLNREGLPFTSTQVISFPVSVELTSAAPPIPMVDVMESDFQGLYPQPPATASFISDYCAMQTPGITYQADQFSEVALAMLDGSYFVPSPEPVVNNEMIIYPNPARTTATVVSPNLTIDEIVMYDQAGRFLRKFEILPGVNEFCLPLEPFAAGIYNVVVTAKSETNVLKLLISD